VYVLELSSFQLETTDSLAPQVAALLNVSADHMDRYTSVDEYARTKARIFAGNGAMVLNRDDERVAAMADAARRVIFYTLDVPRADEFGLRRSGKVAHLCFGESRILAVAELPVAGLHNVSNALAAMAIASALGVSHAVMARALRSFRGLAHRCQLVAESRGVRWFNDSKATNVGASVAAIEGLGDARGPVHGQGDGQENGNGGLILIAGGDAKGADFSALAAPLGRHVRLLLLIGRDAGRIAEVARGQTQIIHAESMADAVEIARQHARAGDSVLLSPACASFDMYANYEARGDAFAAEVRRVLAQ
jgi:UDP-N-acetylmuramoylalanine--D-glutamate ligase